MVEAKDGHIEVICGEMFSGKTWELIRRLRRAEIAKQQLLVFNHYSDTRYGENIIGSHDGPSFEAHAIKDAAEIYELLHDNSDTAVVAIDEAQFIPRISKVAQDLANAHIRVIVAGLDTDFMHRPFGEMPQLIAVAEDVTKLHAICTECQEPASRTQRLVNGKPARWDDPIILVGAQESYTARCREHHYVTVDGEHGDLWINPDNVEEHLASHGQKTSASV